MAKRLWDSFGNPPRLRICALIWLTALSLNAQQQPSVRPKIGVALEGGGALGLAHIGILEWFEEHHIPIDYIAGTSMGGLVGGLYSTGIRAAELRQIVTGMDWSAILSGRRSYQDLTFRRKEDLRKFQNYLDFGLRHGFDAPSGLNNGQEVTFFLDRLALPYSAESFDDLPIPFRCVAVDLVTGKPHVFKDGPLGEALRSTMSLPAVFTPVIRDGRIYADGGLLNNLPVDVVKQMGADIVIAVNLKPSPFNPQDSQSLFSVMGRSISVMIAANELHNAEAADLLISVDLTSYTSSNYAAGEKIVTQGYTAAAQKSALLSRFALDAQTWNQYLEGHDSRRLPAPPAPEFIAVNGVPKPLASEIEAKLAENVGTPLDTKKLERDLNLLAGTSRFSSFSYHLIEEQRKPGIMIHADENAYAPPFIKLGILIDGANYNNVLFTTTARITVMDRAGFGSEWRTDLSMGSEWSAATELYKPLAQSSWFIAPRAYATNEPFNLYDRSTQLADYRIRRSGGALDLGYAINRSSELRLGYDISYFHSSLRVGSPILPTPAGRVGSSSIRYDLDTLDSPVVPRRGQAVRGRFQWTDEYPASRQAFPLAELYVAEVVPVSKPGSVYVQALGGTTFGVQNTGLPQFFLGGPGRLSAYGTNELRTNQYFMFRLGYVHELANLPPLIGNKMYLLSTYELAKIYGLPPSSIVTPSSRLPNDGSVALVLDTLFGPLAIGASVGDTGHHKWYFRLGRIF